MAAPGRLLSVIARSYPWVAAFQERSGGLRPDAASRPIGKRTLNVLAPIRFAGLPAARTYAAAGWTLRSQRKVRGGGTAWK